MYSATYLVAIMQMWVVIEAMRLFHMLALTQLCQAPSHTVGWGQYEGVYKYGKQMNFANTWYFYPFIDEMISQVVANRVTIVFK